MLEWRTVFTSHSLLISQSSALSAPIDRPTRSFPNSLSPSSPFLPLSSTIDSFLCLWLPVCLGVAAEISSAFSLLSPSPLSLFLYALVVCLSPLAYAQHSPFPYHLIPLPSPLPLLLPSAPCLLVLSQLCDCESPCPQQQTLFTLLLNKQGEHDLWWHTLVSSQARSRALTSHEEKTRRKVEIKISLCVSRRSIGTEKIWGWRQWLKRRSNWQARAGEVFKSCELLFCLSC